MEPFKHHIFICTQKKPEGAPSCPARGADQTLAALRRGLADAGLAAEVQVTACGCLGLCGRGPNLVVYPEGVWYAKVTPAAAADIVTQHLKGGRPVARLMMSDAPGMKREILEHDAKVSTMKEIMDKAGALPEALNDFMRGFMESRIALTAIELDLFNAVGGGATAEQAAMRLNLNPRALGMLMNALAAMKLLEKNGATFKNTPLTARYLTTDSPDDSRLAALHPVGLWHRWSTLTDRVKAGTSVAIQKGETRNEQQTKAFIAAMHRNASFRAEMTVAALDLSGVSSVLDLGGGSGAYAIAFARKKPGLAVTVFDIPEVVPLTQKYIADAGLTEKIATVAGDMSRDPLGHNFDLVWISAICHMWGEEENQDLFRRVLAALNPGGQIVIQDFILNDDKTSPRMAAIFALNMLVNTRRGSSYSAKEYTEWLTRAGFQNAAHRPLPGPTGLIIARKPKD